jgi:hypothetical protein
MPHIASDRQERSARIEPRVDFSEQRMPMAELIESVANDAIEAGVGDRRNSDSTTRGETSAFRRGERDGDGAE